MKNILYQINPSLIPHKHILVIDIKMEIVISGVVFGISGLALLNDHKKRLFFENDFIAKKEKNDYKLITGILSDSNNDISLDPVVILCLNSNPLCQIEECEKKIFKSFSQGKYYVYNNRICIHIPITWIIEREYWATISVLTYKSPSVKFNNEYFEFDSEHKIHYTDSQNYSFNNNKLTINKYFPNHSLVTAFARKVPTNEADGDTFKYNIKFMGPLETVIDDVADEYYGISESWTWLLSLGTIISGICFAGAILYKK